MPQALKNDKKNKVLGYLRDSVRDELIKRLVFEYGIRRLKAERLAKTYVAKLTIIELKDIHELKRKRELDAKNKLKNMEKGHKRTALVNELKKGGGKTAAKDKHWKPGANGEKMGPNGAKGKFNKNAKKDNNKGGMGARSPKGKSGGKGKGGRR